MNVIKFISTIYVNFLVKASIWLSTSPQNESKFSNFHTQTQSGQSNHGGKGGDGRGGSEDVIDHIRYFYGGGACLHISWAAHRVSY